MGIGTRVNRGLQEVSRRFEGKEDGLLPVRHRCCEAPLGGGPTGWAGAWVRPLSGGRGPA